MGSRTRLLALAFVVVLFAVACGGGGGGGSSVAPQPPGPAATARFTLTVPRAAAGSRRAPRYISSATGSVAIVSSSLKTVVALSTSNPSCSQSASGLTCVVDGGVPAGTSLVTVSTFASTDGTGTPLSTATISVTVAAGQVTTVDLTLNGVVSTLSLSVFPAVVYPSVPSTSSVTLNALDAAGKIIVGPGNYVDANGAPLNITLSDSDTSGSTHLSATAASAPGGSFTVTYNGAVIPSFTITASATGVTSANASVSVAGGSHNLFVGAAPGTTCTSYATNITAYSTSSQGVGQAGGMLSLQMLGWITVDRVGDLFAVGTDASGQHAGILKYSQGAFGSASPSTTLPSLGSRLAAEAAGGIWTTANDPSGNPMLAHYAAGAAGNATPDRTITGIANLPPSWVLGAHAVAVDSRDNVYTDAEDRNSSEARIYEFTAGSSGVPTPIASYEFTIFGLPDSVGVAIDQHTDMVWMWPSTYQAYTGSNPTPSVIGFAPGSATITRYFTTFVTTPAVSAITYIYAMAFDDSGNAYAEYYAVTHPPSCQHWLAVFGPSQSGSSAPMQTVNLGSNQPGGIAYAVSASPQPTGPSGAQSSEVQPSPSSFAFPGSGSAYAQTLTVAEPGYGGNWSASSANTAIAAVAPGSAPNTFVVSPVDAGTTTIAVRDASGNYANVPVTVSITGFNLHGVRRSPR